MDYSNEFNTTGKFPTMEEFWEGWYDTWGSDKGITPEFSKVLAEQVFRPVYGPATPFYSTFAGRPIEAGNGWQERLIGKTAVKRFNPKASAQDALGFYDSQGLEFNFKIDVEGWIPVSLPSSLVSLNMFIQRNGMGQLNSLLVDNVIQTYQRVMEADIGIKAVSTTSNAITIDQATSEDPQAILKQIQTVANNMRGETTHYNELTPQQQALVYTRSDDVLCFMSQQLLDDIRDSFASLPSPDRIVTNATIIPVPDNLPTPITTAEFEAGVQTEDEPPVTVTAWDPNSKPAAVDQPAPDIWMCARNRIEYRPMENSYIMDLDKNRAGQFVNQHLIWRGAIAVKPWENAVRINLTQA